MTALAARIAHGGRVRSFRVTVFQVSENALDHIGSMISFRTRESETASGYDTSIPAKDLKIPVLGIFRHQLLLAGSLAGRDAATRRASGPGAAGSSKFAEGVALARPELFVP